MTPTSGIAPAHGAHAPSARTMHAATIREGQLVVLEHPIPTPCRGEVLVRIHAAGVNGADLLQLKGRYPAPSDSPADIPGLEFAGEVVVVGGPEGRFAAGASVMGLVGGGAQAEYVVVNERLLSPVPEQLSWTEAGGAPEMFTTAHDAIFSQANLQAGERLLVHGAAGGVGSAGVQLGRAAGAQVTATVRRPELRDDVAELGAKVIAPEGFVQHGPFDVILELIGGSNISEDFNALATGGRLVLIGTGEGTAVHVDFALIKTRRARIHGSTIRARPLEDKAGAARAVERTVLPLLRTGAVRVPVHATYPLSEVSAAYKHFGAGGKLGKIVLTM
jgi:NADPH2:quinone reductase